MISNFPKGQAALLSVLFIFVLGFLTVNGISNVTVGNIRTATDIKESIKSYYIAEGFIEDAVLRYIDDSVGDPVTSTFEHNGIELVRTISGDGPYTIKIESKLGGRHRLIQTQIIQDTSTVNFENGLQAGPGGISINNSATVTGDVCSEGDFIGADTNVVGNVTLISTLTGEDGPNNVDEFTSSSEIFGNVNQYRDAAQSFESEASGGNQLTRVEVYLKKVGNPGSFDLLILPNKLSGGNNYPDNRANALTSQTVPESALSTAGDWVVVTLDDPVTLSPNTKYWIVLDGPAISSASNYWHWYHNNFGSGEGVRMSNWSHNSNPGWEQISADFMFKTFLSDNGVEGVKLQSVNATGIVMADLFVDVESGLGDCLNADCLFVTPTQCSGDKLTKQSDEIQNWLQVAQSGFDCTVTPVPECGDGGDITVSSGEVTLTDMVIDGDLVVNQTGKVILDGTVHVTGSLRVLNSGIIELSANLKELGAGQILVGDPSTGSTGDVTIGNTGAFEGGDSGNILVFSFRNAPTTNSIVLNNSASGDVFFVAPETCIRTSNSTESKALIAYCLEIENSAQINFDSLLGDFFAQTPFTNEIWRVGSWKEVSY